MCLDVSRCVCWKCGDGINNGYLEGVLKGPMWRVLEGCISYRCWELELDLEHTP